MGKTRAECRHLSLHFGSGDYYIFCDDCTASWMARDPLQREYGTDSEGRPVGGSPESANLYRGTEPLCDQKRVAVEPFDGIPK